MSALKFFRLFIPIYPSFLTCNSIFNYLSKRSISFKVLSSKEVLVAKDNLKLCMCEILVFYYFIDYDYKVVVFISRIFSFMY